MEQIGSGSDTTFDILQKSRKSKRNRVRSTFFASPSWIAHMPAPRPPQLGGRPMAAIAPGAARGLHAMLPTARSRIPAAGCCRPLYGAPCDFVGRLQFRQRDCRMPSRRKNLFHEMASRFDEKVFLDGQLVFFERAFDPVHVITFSIRQRPNDLVVARSRTSSRARNQVTNCCTGKRGGRRAGISRRAVILPEQGPLPVVPRQADRGAAHSRIGNVHRLQRHSDCIGAAQGWARCDLIPSPNRGAATVHHDRHR